MAEEEDGGLVVKIGADVANLKAGLTVAKTDVAKFGKEVEDTSKGADTSFAGMARSMVFKLGTLAVAFVTATVSVQNFQKAIDDTKALGDLADAMRTTVDQASRLAEVARQNEVDLATLSRAVETLGRNIAQHANNPMSDLALVASQMGIALHNAFGEARSAAELLPELAARFGTYTDEAGKAALAATFFGRQAGPGMAGLLSQGREELEKSLRLVQANRIATPEQVADARAYTKAVNDATAAINAMSREFMIRLAPAITSAINMITRLLSLLPQVRDTSAGSEDAIRRLSDQILNEEAALATLEGTAARQLEAQGRSHDRTLQQIEAKRRYIQQLRDQLQAENDLAAFQQGPYAPPPPAERGPATPDPDKIRRGFEAGRHELEKLMERLTSQRLLVDELNFTWLSHAQIMEQVTARVNAAFADRAERQRRIAQIELMLEKQKQAAMMQTATMAANLITQLFPKSKAAGIAAAVINTAVGITNALTTGIAPWNWIQAGLIAASGAAQIATIRSTSPSGGPTPTVNGGGAGGGSEDPASTRMLMISGLREEGRYSGSSVIGLIQQINEEVKNGAVLISTTSNRQQSA